MKKTTDKKERVILDLCGGTGSWSKPYRDAGYTVHNITLPEYDVTRVHITKTSILFEGNGAKNLYVAWNEIHGILAAPPCTMFSLARAGAKTPRDLAGAMEVVEACLQIVWRARMHQHTKLKWWALENPRGLLRQFLGKPAYHFQGWWFGDNIKKPTDLWGYFNEPTQKRGTEPEYPRKGPGSWANRSAGGSPQRSMTPAKFALAFYKANK